MWSSIAFIDFTNMAHTFRYSWWLYAPLKLVFDLPINTERRSCRRRRRRRRSSAARSHHAHDIQLLYPGRNRQRRLQSHTCRRQCGRFSQFQRQTTRLFLHDTFYKAPCGKENIAMPVRLIRSELWNFKLSIFAPHILSYLTSGENKLQVINFFKKYKNLK